MTRKSLITVLGTIFALLLLSTTPVAGASSSPNSGVAKHWTVSGPQAAQFFTINFGGSSESHHFTIFASGGSKLVVKTLDCCIAGDHWGLLLNDTVGGSTVGVKDHVKGNCGTGSTSAYTGPVALGSSFSPYSGESRLQVTYCSGTDIFPAGMTVGFSYNGPNLTVTQDT